MREVSEVACTLSSAPMSDLAVVCVQSNAAESTRMSELEYKVSAGGCSALLSSKQHSNLNLICVSRV